MKNLNSTTEAQTTKKVVMYQQIEAHGQNLNNIFNTGIDNVTLCKKLHRLEKQAHRIATDYCNGENGVDSEIIDSFVNPILAKVVKLLGNGCPVQFNGDARGYALKISDKIVRANGLKIYTDMGGYGIICPEFNGN